jgi:ABC-type phosphate/phosphonate transport system substrate-binding protein
MYDWPEVAWATDALWCAVAGQLTAAGVAAPAVLDRSRDAEIVWRDPGLVLSQICGFPVATSLRDSVQLVATPVYDVEGCEGPRYSSFIVASSEERGGTLADFAGRRVAFNSHDSLSGYVTLVAALREAGLSPDQFEWVETGSHRASVRAMAEGRADLAAIDALCWALALSFEAAAVSRLQTIGQTPLRPAPPTITSAGRSPEEVEAIRAALSHAAASRATEEARKALRIDGVAVLGTADYEPLANLMR